MIKKENKKENNDFIEDLKRLHLPYPTIYYLKDAEKNKFFLCYEWFDLNEKIEIITTGGAKITKNDQGCRVVNNDTVKSLLKTRFHSKPVP